jgi:hypothetical protein
LIWSRKLLFIGMLFIPWARAETPSQPYIDQVQKEWREDGIKEKSYGSGTQPYIDSLKRGFSHQKDEQPNYIDRLRNEDPSLSPSPSSSYIEKEKQELPDEKNESAIQALKEGHSELHPKFEGKINHAFGLRYGVGVSRDTTSPSQVSSFKTVYGANYTPEIHLFYEFQPFHSEIFGNVGIFGMAGMSYSEGKGQFAIPLTIPGSGGAKFSSTSTTKFQFIAVPVTIGLDYRFNLFQVLRPHVMAGPTIVGFLEDRSDKDPDSHGHSEGVFFCVGVSLLLDWVSTSSSSSLYSSFGIKHSYFTVDYSRTTTFTGDLLYNVSGIYAGFTFEY